MGPVIELVKNLVISHVSWSTQHVCVHGPLQHPLSRHDTRHTKAQSQDILAQWLDTQPQLLHFWVYNLGKVPAHSVPKVK